MSRSFSFVAAALLASSVSAFAQTPNPTPVTIVIDNFESGVANWTSNDKNRVGLSDIVATTPGAFNRSKGAALMTFKAGNASWASLSRAVDGQAWSDAGAQTLSFSMNGGGETLGVTLQLRGKVNGADVTYSLPRPVRLDIVKWRTVAIPLSDFKGPKGEAISPRLSGIYLLQFQQSGAWGSRFFSIDDIEIKGTGRPLVQPTPTPAPRATTAPGATTGSNGETTVQVDFLKTSSQIRAAANVSLGAPMDARTQVVLDSSPTFRQAVSTLAPRWIRLDAAALVDIADSSKPTFSFARLTATAERARGLKAQILVSLPNAAEWGLDENGYAALCTQAARALRAQNVRAWELATSSNDLNDATALSFYNAGYSALKTASKSYLVGGSGMSAGDATSVGALLKGARGLDFLSVRFYGTPDGSADDATVLASARTIGGVKTAAGLLDKSRFRRAALFVSEASLAGAGNIGTTPDDPRLTQMLAGAWWGQFLASGSRLADQIFTPDATNAEWGLLDASSKAYPAYYASWMWNTFFPPGSTRVSATSSSDAIFVTAANTATAHNIYLVNTTGETRSAQIAIRGFAVLRQARIRIFDDPRQSVRFDDLPKSPFQTIKLAPYAVAVVQFIEPPKNNALSPPSNINPASCHRRSRCEASAPPMQENSGLQDWIAVNLGEFCSVQPRRLPLGTRYLVMILTTVFIGITNRIHGWPLWAYYLPKLTLALGAGLVLGYWQERTLWQLVTPQWRVLLLRFIGYAAVCWATTMVLFLCAHDLFESIASFVTFLVVASLLSGAVWWAKRLLNTFLCPHCNHHYFGLQTQWSFNEGFLLFGVGRWPSTRCHHCDWLLCQPEDERFIV